MPDTGSVSGPMIYSMDLRTATRSSQRCAASSLTHGVFPTMYSTTSFTSSGGRWGNSFPGGVRRKQGQDVADGRKPASAVFTRHESGRRNPRVMDKARTKVQGSTLSFTVAPASNRAETIVGMLRRCNEKVKTVTVCPSRRTGTGMLIQEAKHPNRAAAWHNICTTCRPFCSATFASPSVQNAHPAATNAAVPTGQTACRHSRDLGPFIICRTASEFPSAAA